MGPVTGKKVYVTCIWIGSMEWGFHGAGFSFGFYQAVFLYRPVWSLTRIHPVKP